MNIVQNDELSMSPLIASPSPHSDNNVATKSKATGDRLSIKCSCTAALATSYTHFEFLQIMSTTRKLLQEWKVLSLLLCSVLVSGVDDRCNLRAGSDFAEGCAIAQDIVQPPRHSSWIVANDGGTCIQLNCSSSSSASGFASQGECVGACAPAGITNLTEFLDPCNVATPVFRPLRSMFQDLYALTVVGLGWFIITVPPSAVHSLQYKLQYKEPQILVFLSRFPYLYHDSI